MRLQEAIKELQSYNFLCEPAEADKLSRAVNLAIEALKRVEHTRHEAPEFVIPLLPGETEEEQCQLGDENEI